jgi:hypothetical protein
MSAHSQHNTTTDKSVLPGQAINTPARVSSKPKRKRLSGIKQRALLEAAIERLVELLDETEPAPDLELECEDEGAQCEDEGTDGYMLGHGVDDEPSLGSLDRMMDQTKWAKGNDGWHGNEDCELDTADNELSLGWTEAFTQGPGRLGNARDLEIQCEDEGADHDGREPDYPKPPKGYMHPENLGPANSAGLMKGGQSWLALVLPWRLYLLWGLPRTPNPQATRS